MSFVQLELRSSIYGTLKIEIPDFLLELEQPKIKASNLLQSLISDSGTSLINFKPKLDCLKLYLL